MLKWIKNIEETITALVDIVKQFFDLFIGFIPPPLDAIVKTFCLILLVLCVIKLTKILTGLIGNLISSII